MGVLSRLRKNESGNVAIVFSLAIIPMMLAAGVGIDMIRANQSRTVLQAAADAAALAGGSSNKSTKAELEKIALDYIAANGAAEAVASLDDIKIKNNDGTGAFSVTLKGKVSTSFMALAGIKSIDVDATSEVKRGSAGPLEMVLALDTTYSMTENDKIGTLKTAAATMVNSVMATGNVKVGVVPFSDYFHVGLKYKNEPWISLPPEKTETYESCSYYYPDRSGCTTATTCYADGVPYACNVETCTYWGDPVKSNCASNTVTYKFEGCIAARPEAYHNSIDDATKAPYPGVTWACGAPMLAMTDVKSDVLDAIDALWPNGNTNIPSGLVWAWNMLTPEAPLTEAAPMATINAKGGKKALVLMTDGVNSSSPFDDGNYGIHSETKYGTGEYTDNLTAELCQKIKDEGTIVYTVLFDVTDSNIETLLRNCASEAANSFVANDAAELISAFGKIGTSLTQLRLTR